MIEDQSDLLVAKANLARMRGDYASAKESLRSVLEDYPEDHDALSLMGDICHAEGALDTASQFYEQAVLAGGQISDKSKWEAVKKQISDREAADVVKSLGLPTTASKAKLWVVSSAVFVVGIGLAGYFVGNWSGAKSKPPVDITTPIVIEPIAAEAKPTAGETPTLEPSRRDSGVTVIDYRPNEDKLLLGSLKSRLTSPDAITDARQDLRSKAIEVTIRAEEGVDVKQLAATQGTAILDVQAECPEVKIRIDQGGKVVYAADLLRADVDVAKNSGQTQNPVTFLRNEWIAGT